MSAPTRRAVMTGVASFAVPLRAATAELVVSRSGRPGTFGTIADALAHAGPGARLRLDAGVWQEKLTLDVPGVTIVGAGPASIISFGASSGTARPDGGTWGTGGSATLSVKAPGVTLRDLTIRNSFDYLGARRDAAGNGAQAVALLLDRAADRTRLIDCAVEGYQDSLYVNARALIERCRIVGGTDFIFGGGAALFRGCTIVTRYVPGADPQGYVAAPSTPADQRFGLVFDRCRLGRDSGVPDGSAWLGRPWRAGGNMALTGSATFLRCWMDAHIRAAGWTRMGFRSPDGEQRWLTPPEARLAEWRSTGPGAGAAGPDRRVLSDAEAAAFTPSAILSGWTG